MRTMFLKRPVLVLVSFVFIMQVSLTVSKKSKSTKDSTSSASYKSAHQYGPSEKFRVLKPSKPDPHFEILDEQRGINFATRPREGRSSSGERSSDTFKHSSASSGYSKKIKKGKRTKASFKDTSTSPTFGNKIKDKTRPKFSSSQLISGSAGLITPAFKSPELDKDGWKILMGPSVAPNEPLPSESPTADYSAFGDGEQKTVTELKRLERRSKSKSKYVLNAFSSGSSKGYHRSVSKVPKPDMHIAIPKQSIKYKYATVTRRAPSKSTKGSGRTAKKVQMSLSNSKTVQKSYPTNKDTSQYFNSYSSTENNENFKPSPVMTLDTKKLIIESGETTNEKYSGEQSYTASSEPSVANNRYYSVPSYPNEDDLVTSDHENFQQSTSVSASMSYPMNVPSHSSDQADIITASVQNDLNSLALDTPIEPGFAPEPILASDMIEESILPAPPDFMHSNRVPSGVQESFGESRFPINHAKIPPFRRIPVPLPDFTESNFPMKVVPSADPNRKIIITTSGYPPIRVNSNKHTPREMFSHPGQHGSSTNMQVPGPSHHIPHVLPPPPPPPHPYHHLHLPLHHPGPPYPPHNGFDPGRNPLINPFEFETGRGAPPGGVPFSGRGIPSLPPPPAGVDPAHPAVQHALRNPHSLLHESASVEPVVGNSNVVESNKHYLHYSVHKGSLVPLDKKLVYLSMIVSWMFWISAFYSYYRWSVKGNKGKQVYLSVPSNGESPLVTTR